MNIIQYKNKANQNIIIAYYYRYFKESQIKSLLGKQTIVSATINGKKIMSFYMPGYKEEKEIKTALSKLRKRRKRLKLA